MRGNERILCGRNINLDIYIEVISINCRLYFEINISILENNVVRVVIYILYYIARRFCCLLKYISFLVSVINLNLNFVPNILF